MSGSSFNSLPEDVLLQVNRVCNQFEAACQAAPDQTPRIEDWLSEVDPQFQPSALEELLPVEIAYRQQSGDACDLDELRQRFPETDSAWLREQLGGATIRLSGSSESAIDALTRPPAQSDDESDMPERIGDYDLQCVIGRGGMGAVYRAVHRRMDRTVALKVLRPEISRDPVLKQRFEREVRAAAKLSHPNIVAAYDAREEDGLYCLITEFIDGDDLNAMVRRDGPLPVAEAIDVILQAARGLEYAHARGIIHRDIKPANLLCDSDGMVRILDMGLARIASDSSDLEATDLTSTGMVMGTAAYMSPEQARNTKNADARSDIYSLGCTLFFLLTGRPAYNGETVVDTIFAHASDPIPSLGNSADQPISPALDQLFRRMVAKRADDRFASMTEVVAALNSLLAGDASISTETSDNLQSIAGKPTSTTGSDATGSDATIPIGGTSGGEITPLEDARINASRPVASPLASPEPAARKARLAVLGAGLLAAAAAGVIAWPLLPSPGSAGWPDSEKTDGDVASPGFSLKFDGQSSYVEVPTLIPNPTKPVTLEVICAIDQFRTSNMISWLGPDWMALFVTDDGRFGVGRLDGTVPRLIRTQIRAQTGRNYHVAGQWDGSELSLFIDGQPAETRPMGFDLPVTDGGLYIGGVRPDRLPGDQNDRFFNGRIDAVRISYDTVYFEPFAAPVQLEVRPETLVLYQFDEGSGMTTANSVATEHAGTLNNAQWQAN
jgi:serine/threonine protein kinase